MFEKYNVPDIWNDITIFFVDISKVKEDKQILNKILVNDDKKLKNTLK